MLVPLPRRSLLKSWQLKFEVIWFWLISPSGTMGRGQTLEGLGGKWEGVKSAFDTVCLSSSNKSWSWWGKGQSGFRTICNFFLYVSGMYLYVQLKALKSSSSPLYVFRSQCAVSDKPFHFPLRQFLHCHYLALATMLNSSTSKGF